MHEHREESEMVCVICDAEVPEESPIWKDSRISIIVLSTILLSAGLFFKLILKLELLAGILFLATALISGYSIAREGFSSLIFRKRLSIDFLMIIAAVVAFSLVMEKRGQW